MLPGVGRGAFDIALEPTGADPIDFHEALLRTGASHWGQVDSFFVIDGPDGSPGAAMGYFLSARPDRRPLTAEGFKRVSEHLGWPRLASGEFWRRYTRFFGLFGDAPQLAQPADYVLEYAAVRPELQRRGLYGRLTEAHAEQARAMGCRTLGGTAVFGNDKVLGALLKAGFREHARFGPEHYGGEFPGMIRLVRAL
jgi:GNAT superfamily N-acetyltransferase